MADLFQSATDQGVTAISPPSLTPGDWISIIRRAWTCIRIHHLSLMAAGIASCAFLSSIPMLGVLVMIFGLFANASDVAEHVHVLNAIAPREAGLIDELLLAIINAPADQKALALVVALGLSIVGASRASGAVIGVMNIIYEQTDSCRVIRRLMRSVALVFAAVITAVFGMLAAGLFTYAGLLFPALGTLVSPVARILTWAAVAVLSTFTLGAVYRFGPDRTEPGWQWLSVGSVLGTALWLTGTLLFSVYIANFGTCDAICGSLGAVVVLLVWLYVSSYAVLIGAVVNAETERQAARGSTI